MMNEDIEEKAGDTCANIGPDALQAYDEAARAVCPMCADGYPAVLVKGERRYIHSDIVACSASAIYLLKEPLQRDSRTRA